MVIATIYGNKKLPTISAFIEAAVTSHEYVADCSDENMFTYFMEQSEFITRDVETTKLFFLGSPVNIGKKSTFMTYLIYIFIFKVAVLSQEGKTIEDKYRFLEGLWTEFQMIYEFTKLNDYSGRGDSITNVSLFGKCYITNLHITGILPMVLESLVNKEESKKVAAAYAECIDDSVVSPPSFCIGSICKSCGNSVPSS